MQTNQSASDDAPIIAPDTAPDPATNTSKPATMTETQHTLNKTITRPHTTPPDNTPDTCITSKKGSDLSPTESKAEEAVENLRVAHKIPKYNFVPDRKPMLSQKGRYPVRSDIPLQYWEWVVRSEQPGSPWFSDWENSLERAGWIIIRGLTDAETNELPYNEMDPAYPGDADLYCPTRKIYVTLLPSWVPGDPDYLLERMKSGYPGSMAIIHARDTLKHPVEFDGFRSPRSLLSKRNTARCLELGAYVEFRGVLYTPDEDHVWKATEDPGALDIYHEYRVNSIYYHEEQEQIDRSWEAFLRTAFVTP